MTDTTPTSSGAGRGQPGRRGRRGGRGGRGGRGEATMVPDATFSSYYGRPILKAPVWAELDIAGYLFTGGLAAGSAMLAAGADLTARPALARVGRLTAAGALGVSFVALVHDLGRPGRFVNMLRVVKPTSPMSVGTWILSAFSVPVAVGAAAELPGVVPAPLRPVVAAMARPAGVAGALIAPAVASYTAVLVADTAVPTWNAAYPELPFVFVGSAAAAASGVGLIAAARGEAGPARRFAVLGAAVELAAMHRAESRIGLLAEPLHTGSAGRLLRAARALTGGGALGAALLAPRSRSAAVVAGSALVTGSVLTRFGIFRAGVASTQDPQYVVRPQRDRLNDRQPPPSASSSP